MAEDASFHSCCEELPQLHQLHQPHQLQPCCWTADRSCCSSDTDDDGAQFLTASNSPQQQELDASDCCGGGGGDPERTLGGDSLKSPPTPPSPVRDRLLAVVSTVTAAEPRTRGDSGGGGGGGVVGGGGGGNFPPPLASSSRVSLQGLQETMRDLQLSDSTRLSGSPDDSAVALVCLYYRDNDLTLHRPASRRTQSCPIGVVRQLSAGQLLPGPASGGRAHGRLHRRHKRDTVDFPTRLRKRVRFADALGFDLASVVEFTCVGRDNGRQLDSGRSGGCADDYSVDSEFNEGHVFAESPLATPADPAWAPLTPWSPTLPTDRQPVALESVRFDGCLALELTACVRNLAPIKSVTARVTFDAWRHQADWSLRYAESQPRLGLDRFRMRLYLPPNACGLELVLRYCVAGQQYWDNNADRNYVYRREARV